MDFARPQSSSRISSVSWFLQKTQTGFVVFEMKLSHNFGCFGDETNFNQLEEGIEISGRNRSIEGCLMSKDTKKFLS